MISQTQFIWRRKLHEPIAKKTSQENREVFTVCYVALMSIVCLKRNTTVCGLHLHKCFQNKISEMDGFYLQQVGFSFCERKTGIRQFVLSPEHGVYNVILLGPVDRKTAVLV